MNNEKQSVKKPRLIEYMISWGLTGGILLIQVYSLAEALFLNGQTYSDGYLTILVCMFSFFFGGVPCYILGLLTTGAIQLVAGKTPEHLHYNDMLWYRTKVYLLSLLIPGLSVLALTSCYWVNSPDTWAVLYGGLFPTIFVTLVFTYAAHRYLLRLQHYYEQTGSEQEKRKAKPKHDINRLEDSLEESEFYEDEEAARQRREE